MSDTYVIATGGFDPLHAGHISYLQAASTMGKLIVGVNSDSWLERKKGKPFMNFRDRLSVVASLKPVNRAMGFDDADGSARDIIKTVLSHASGKVIFANGGDRTAENIPEMDIVDPRLQFKFGVGGENKQNSSSEMLSRWQQPQSVLRAWGEYTVLDEGPGYKVKRLEIYPQKSISAQYHKLRAEEWFIVRGTGKAVLDGLPFSVMEGNSFHVDVGCVHKVTNTHTQDMLVAIEIQTGQQCIESDIVRV